MMQGWADYLDNLKAQAQTGNVITASEQLGDAMIQRHEMMAAIMDVVTSYITGKEITDDMRDQLGEAAELLNAEIDAMERILVEH
jgi:hypothetical protein